MLKLVGWVVGIVLFVWATVSAFSILSELKFPVDGWSWSIGHVPIPIKAIAPAVGKYVSGIVGSYREFIRGLVAMLHLPHLPQYAYDALGVIGFSIGRGYWLGQKSNRALEEKATAYMASLGFVNGQPSVEITAEELFKNLDSIRNEYPLMQKVISIKNIITGAFKAIFWRGQSPKMTSLRAERLLYFVADFVGIVVVFGGLVALVLAALFGIDFVYRTSLGD